MALGGDLIKQIAERGKDIQNISIDSGGRERKQGASEDETQLSVFDYSGVDEETATYLHEKAINIVQINAVSIAAIGKELKEVQERLAKRGYGCFQEWAKSVGISKSSVYRYMDVYNLFVSHVGQTEFLEKAPARLLYDIAKPSARKELVDAVVAGEVTTVNGLKEMEDRLREEEVKVKDRDTQISTLTDEKLNILQELGESKKANNDLNRVLREKERIISEMKTAPIEVSAKIVSEPDTHMAMNQGELARQVESYVKCATILAKIDILESLVKELGRETEGLDVDEIEEHTREKVHSRLEDIQDRIINIQDVFEKN